MLACFAVSVTSAQESSVSAGGDATGSGGSASYSIGQVAYISANDGSFSSSEGVQQPYEVSIVTAVNEMASTVSYTVFPNPTVSGVNLSLSENNGNLNVQLFNIEGKMISEEKINGLNTNVQMEALASGTYLLNVTDNKKVVKTFRVIKNK